MFITFEGIEGVGKSTHMQFVASLLQEKSIPYQKTREPGGTEIGEEIRAILLKHREGSVSTLAELLLLFAARAEHMETVIKPAISKQEWVLCDRFIDATYAYQGGGRKMPLAQIDSLAALVLGSLQPDLVLIFDVDPAIGLQRTLARRQGWDRFESENLVFFERVREAYLLRARLDPTRYKVMDASRPIALIQQELREMVEDIIKKNRVQSLGYVP